jgi:hypothetical protein
MSFGGCGISANTYQDIVPLAEKERGFFCGAKTARIHIHAQSECDEHGFNYTAVVMESCDDAMWKGVCAGTPFSIVEMWRMQQEYLKQIPETGATESNFRSFFTRKGFTQFDGRLPSEEGEEHVVCSGYEELLATINKNLAIIHSDPAGKIADALLALVKTEEGRFIIDDILQWVPDTIKHCWYDVRVAVDSVQDAGILCCFTFSSDDGWEHDTRYMHVPAEWLADEKSLRKASAEYWRKKQEQELAKKKKQEAEKNEEEYKLYLKLEKKYGGRKNG